MKKYKTNNLFDGMEQNNSYIVIDNSNSQNIAMLVDESDDPNKPDKRLDNKDSEELTLTSAMEKYFYPKIYKLDASVKKIEDTCKKIDSELPKKPKRKKKALRIILESLLALGIGTIGGYAFSINMGSNFLRPLLMFGGACAVVSGGIIGLFDYLIYRARAKERNDEIKYLHQKLILLIQWDNKYIVEFVNNIDLFKSQINLKNYSLCSPLVDMQTSVANFNKAIINIIKRIYDYKQNEMFVSLVSKYDSIDNCYENTNSILADFDFLKKNLPTLSVIVPETIAQNDRDMVYSLRNEESKLLTKTLIPFAQVLNVTYDKVYQNYLEEKRKEEEKQHQEEMRQKEEERKRIEREQEEEKLRKELKQKEFEKENKKYKQFFDNYGIEAELDQEEQTK